MKLSGDDANRWEQTSNKLREFEASLSEKNYHKRQGFFDRLREAFDKDKDK